MPHDSSDVAIVGAGACGSLMAKELAGRGLSVVVLEPLIEDHTPVASLFSASIPLRIEGAVFERAHRVRSNRMNLSVHARLVQTATRPAVAFPRTSRKLFSAQIAIIVMREPRCAA
jgi:choline dehydrogenase-like flavoprotein